MEKVVIFHFRKEKSRLKREEPCDKDCMAQEGRKETFQGSRHRDPCPMMPTYWSGLWWRSTGHLKEMNGKWADGIQSVSAIVPQCLGGLLAHLRLEGGRVGSLHSHMGSFCVEFSPASSLLVSFLGLRCSGTRLGEKLWPYCFSELPIKREN